MENLNLVLKFKDQEQEYSFENKVALVEDKKLIQNLSRPNIKNQDSSLLIKSLNETHISDVIQIKINVAETGAFLVSFEKGSLPEETRTKLLEEIGKLKNTDAPSKDGSIQKIKELLGILNNYHPIYATFSNSGDIKIEISDIEQFVLNFPLLMLAQPQRKMIFKVGKTKEEEPKEVKAKVKKEKPAKPEKVHKDKEHKEKVHKEYKPFALFDSDYFFVLFFAFLGAFSITASVFELMNKENISIFLIILAVILTITLVIAITSVVYKKGELRNPWLRYYLGIYVLIGLVIGVVSSFFVCKGLLKTEIEDFDYKKMILISSLVSASLLASLSLSRLANLINIGILKKKSQ